MKKLILFISVIGLFALASCNTKNPTDESSNSNPITDTTTQNEPSESSENIPSKSGDDTSPNTQESSDNTSSTKDESTKDENVYDDGIDWGPLHQ